MEKRKLLLVIISVGIFLVIVIAVSYFMFYPNSRGTGLMAGINTPIPAGTDTNSSSPVSADPTEWVRNPQGVQGLQTPPETNSSQGGDVIIIYGDTQNTAASNATEIVETDPRDSSGALVIAVPKPDEKPLPEASVQVQKTETSAKPVEQSQLLDTNKTEVAVSSTASSVTPKPAVKPAAIKTVTVKTYEDYWVQTGAFSSKVLADTAKEALSEKGISSLLELKNMDNKTYYRVRVGPYTSKNEADYWLSLIKSIQGFEESYISLVTSKR